MNWLAQPNDHRSLSSLRFVPPLKSLGALLLVLLVYLVFSSSAESAPAIGVPDLVSPPDATTTTVGNYPPLAIPEFVWSAVTGATNYRIQFSNDIGFATIQLELTTPNTSFTPTGVNVFSDGNWYWRVRAESPSVGFYSPSQSFTKQWASPSNLPVLTSPDDAATVEFDDQPVFSWQPVSGASSYRLQIATSPGGFGSPLYDQTTLAFTHQPSAKLANGTYYWRVVPKDPAGRNGTPSLVRSFTEEYAEVPALIEPINNSTPTFTPTFRWNAVRGAQFYRLQYSTDPSFNTALNQVDTRNTSFTPNNTLPNDVNFYWRVATYSGSSVSDWSTVWTFVKRWYLQPELLTPTNNFQFVSEPFFSWSPVPAAHSYRIEVSPVNSFPPTCGFTDSTVNPFYVKPDWTWETNCVNPTDPVWYWRVTPVDSNGNMGKPSVVYSFVNPTLPPLSRTVPRQIFPFYYYSPTITYSPTIGMQPHEDRSVAYPVFSWHRTLSPTNYTVFTPTIGQIPAYRLQVSPDPLFPPDPWTLDTENLYGAPSATNLFTPTGGTYYWRVQTLDGVGGTPIGPWSQTWKTRIDSSLALTPTADITPTLLRPVPASEWVEGMPLFEWEPAQDADSYGIDISDDPAFASTLVSATVTYPVYAPTARLPYGTYYWRVQSFSGGVPTGVYSPVWRFQVAAQSRWRENRTPGAAANRILIGSDPAGDMTDPNYDLTTLYASQAKDYWYFGFNATSSGVVTYGLYIDLDHVDGSGATYDARGLNISTIPAHQPEYAIYIIISGTPAINQTFVYPWTGIGWGTPQSLDSIGGGLFYDPDDHYIEIRVPNTAIGMQETTGSASLSLFSAPAGGHAQDTVPSDPNVAFTAPDFGITPTVLSRFTSVSEKLTVAIPPNNITGDPSEYSSVIPFLWQLPVDVPAWFGYNLQVHKDPQYTSVVWDYTVQNSPLIPPDHTYINGDLVGNNTYYWRVRPVYGLLLGGNSRGAWSQPTAFDRQGFVPQNLTISVSYATPTFSWDLVEGTEFYDIQVTPDPNFGSTAISASTARVSYTPVRTLDNGTYYWRVRMRRAGGAVNNWTPVLSFTLNLTVPTGLVTVPPTPPPGNALARAPALCWNPVIATTGAGTPVFAAWRYRVQLSKNDPTFSSLFDSTDTEQSCWTTQHGMDDATYYWRVAVMDGEGRLGSFATADPFTKQYPVTTLLNPHDGSILGSTPTFVWTAVDGAARYHLQVSQVNTFSPLYDEVTTNNTRYTPTRTYGTGVTYFWRVAIIDQDGKQGPYNTATLILSTLPYKLALPMIVH